MKHTREEIIQALTVIKDECNEAKNCCYCPFGRECGMCNIRNDSPYEWKFNEEEPVYRAFP